MNDFQSEPEELRTSELRALDGVLRSGWFVLGAEVSAFEREWAERCRLPHAIGVANGMDAIEIGLRGLGIGHGDEVITTPMTAFATVLAIIRTGATPVLADINPETALLDSASVARCITPRTKAVLLVHLYGQITEMDGWLDLCRSARIELVEDCAQAHLAAWKGRCAGSFGAFGAYSFYPTKNLGALGDAGALVCADADLDSRARVLRNYGQAGRYHHPALGLNSRLDELQAALLRVRLGWLDRFTARRRKIAARYRAGISNSAVSLLTAPADPASHVYHLFVVRSERREELAAHLLRAGVQNHVHYPMPVHEQPPCRGVERDPKGLFFAERHAATCLSLPCHPQLSDAQVDRVVSAVNDFS